jgi:uncharacterized membrane protein
VRGRRAGHGHARRAAQLSVLALALALGSSVVWGTADFAGGSLTKRLPTFAVTIWSQSVGLMALVAVVAFREHVGMHAFALGLLAGAGGGSGLAAFYKALSLGTMSVVSPLVACGALVPFTVSVATGERPSAIAVVGALLALSGAVLASVEEHRSASPARSQALLLALVAAVMLGLFVYFLGLGSREGDALSALLGARVGSLFVLVGIALGRRAPLRLGPRTLLPVAAVGLGDVSANALFAFASGRGLLSLVSVLGSMFPVVTVLLAHVLLGERLTRAQRAGIGIALVGVAAIASG